MTEPTILPAANKDAAEAESATIKPFEDLRYPESVGSSEYPHFLKIDIFRQKNSSMPSAPFGSGSSLNIKAGTQRPTVLPIGLGGIATAGAIKFFSGSLNPVGLVALGAAAVYGTEAVAEGVSFVAKQLGADPSGADRVAKQAESIISGVKKGVQNLDFPLSRTTKERIGSIKLYTPNGIQVNDKHDFDNVSVTEALGLAGLAQEGLAGGNSTAVAVSEVIPTVLKNFGVVGERAAQISVAGQGYAINPLLQVVYQQTKNREFEFKFKFAPRSKKEADDVLKIIKALRYHSYPEYSQNIGSRYFVPPSEFVITHYYQLKPNETLPKIYQSVLSGVRVEYSPNATFSTFDDGMPVEINMILTFTETVALTKTDIAAGY